MEVLPAGDQDNAASAIPRGLQKNEFCTADLAPGQIALVEVDGDEVAVYNAAGEFFATQNRCSHTGWPLNDGGDMDGRRVTCPLHGWCYDVATGEVVRGMKSLPLRTYRVIVHESIGRVEMLN